MFGAAELRCPPTVAAVGGESGAPRRAARNVPDSRDRDARAAARLVLQRGAAIPQRRLWGARAERERHATCLTRAIATRTRRDAWCCRAALPSHSGGCGGRERSASGSASGNVSDSRNRCAHAAARLVLPRGAGSGS